MSGRSKRPTKWTLSLSWGPSGGVYLHPHRICLWKLALTFNPKVEIDDLMEVWVEHHEAAR